MARGAGQLDTPITIEYPSRTNTPEYGDQPGPWLPLIQEVGSPTIAVKLLASVQDITGSEAVRQGLEIGRDQTKITIRYRPDVTSAMRITVHRQVDAVYQIVKGPTEIGRRRWTEFIVEKYTS